MKLRNKKTGEVGNLVLNINPNRESYSRFKKDLNTALERLAHGFYEDAKEFMEDRNDILELHEKLNRGSEE